MSRLFIPLILFIATFLVALPTASAVSISWIPVGNPGNAPDPIVDLSGTSGRGSVPYAYNIDKYDVTNSQYVEFLNAKDPTGANTLLLYDSSMGSSEFGGINYNAGAASGIKYTVRSGRGDNPVNYQTFYDALRFANWLNNGQGNGDTESGAYTLLGGKATPTNASSITRNAGANIFIPNENEWYKAAYYNPDTKSYYQYPTSSNTLPTPGAPSATPNSANYDGNFHGVELTPVGSYTASASPYGAFDMGGDVNQWNESVISGSLRGMRGGSFDLSGNYLQSNFRNSFTPTVGRFDLGFRVAMVPEPSTLALAALGSISLLAFSCRFR